MIFVSVYYSTTWLIKKNEKVSIRLDITELSQLPKVKKIVKFIDLHTFLDSSIF